MRLFSSVSFADEVFLDVFETEDDVNYFPHNLEHKSFLL